MEHNGKPFRFKKFEVYQREDVFKVNTDGVLCAAWVESFDGDNVLEIGSGTGVMSLVLAQKFPDKKIVTIEIQRAAAALTRYNIQHNLPLSASIECIEKDVAAYVTEVTFDVIISNPPYYQEDSLSHSNHDKIAKHSLYLNREHLLQAIEGLSHPKTMLYLVFPIVEGNKFIEEAALFQWYPNRIMYLKPSPDKPLHRMLICLTKEKTAIKEDTILILGPDRQYTEAYKKMTQDYYIIF